MVFFGPILAGKILMTTALVGKKTYFLWLMTTVYYKYLKVLKQL